MRFSVVGLGSSRVQGSVLSRGLPLHAGPEPTCRNLGPFLTHTHFAVLCQLPVLDTPAIGNLSITIGKCAIVVYCSVRRNRGASIDTKIFSNNFWGILHSKTVTEGLLSLLIPKLAKCQAPMLQRSEEWGLRGSRLLRRPVYDRGSEFRV